MTPHTAPVPSLDKVRGFNDKPNTNMQTSAIDQIREATSVELVQELLAKFSTFNYRFASPKTINKARKVAQDRISYLKAK